MSFTGKSWTQFQENDFWSEQRNRILSSQEFNFQTIIFNPLCTSWLWYNYGIYADLHVCILNNTY